MKIICATRGRLGNNMFCLAGAYKIAKEKNAEVVGWFHNDHYAVQSEYIRNTILRKTPYLNNFDKNGIIKQSPISLKLHEKRLKIL